MSNDIESVQTFIPALLQIGERMKQDSDRIATLEQQLRDREAELLRVRTHETAAAHELDVKLTPEERHTFKTMADRIATLEATLTQKQRAIDGAIAIYDRWMKTPSNERPHSVLGTVAAILRPEATPTPVDNAVADRATTVGSEQTDAKHRKKPEPVDEHGMTKRDRMIAAGVAPNQIPPHIQLPGDADCREPQPAQPEPSGDTNRDTLSRSDDRALRLTFAERVQAMASMFGAVNDALGEGCTAKKMVEFYGEELGITAWDTKFFLPACAIECRRRLDAIIAECDGGAK